ncbi:folate-binding protein [Halopseudomonas pelagia]|uniref:CAF17-like 4Fe-4S cluster assembly/insertion protein YgfZ n=1 Tax=Halopseudomonas pelagia TaxID=553151 RepID=UPI0030DB5BE0|tara:strand:- start:842 stop:1873 length:1032 start_codon:yes stop_codon:yes gene_type:complete
MSTITAPEQILQDRFAASAQNQGEMPVTGMTWLGHERILCVDGIDAKRFLQGQLTCDVNLLANPGSTLGARCNPKGRIQSSFRLLHHAENTYLLALHKDVLESQSSDLGKYAVFFKASISDASPDWVRIGLWGPQAAQALHHTGFTPPEHTDQVTTSPRGAVIRVPGIDRFEVWLAEETALPTLDLMQTIATPTALNAWLLLQIRNGLGEIDAATRESFIPQMLNMQLFGAVSFRKGCYTGQEIVARMQYLGKLKRRMFRLLMTGDQPLPAGTPIVNHASGQTLGEVVLSACAGTQVEILAVLQKDAAQLVQLSAIDSEGPLLTIADLPYDIELAASEAAPAN